MKLERKTLVVNLFAGPGAGKSTTAAGLFYKLKMENISCELVTEFAKDLTWSGYDHTLEIQPHIFGEQLYRLERLKGKVSVVITDSPILLSAVYGYKWPDSFQQSVVDIFNQWWNVNFFLERMKPYNPAGRGGDESIARAIDNSVRSALEKYAIEADFLPGDDKTVDKIAEKVYNTMGVW